MNNFMSNSWRYVSKGLAMAPPAATDRLGVSTYRKSFRFK